jgi:hypothetical protein
MQGAINAFCSKSWKYQESYYVTPLRPECVADMIISRMTDRHQARIIFDEIVFEPTTLNLILSKCGTTTPSMRDTKYLKDWVAETTTSSETRRLLVAVLKDAIDFVFEPIGRRSFSLYVDHDERITVFSNSRAEVKWTWDQ